jgi:hypothetical protein
MTRSKPLSFLVSFALVSALAVSLAGCATTEQPGSGSTTVTRSGHCAPGQTIERYCATQGGCVSYDAHVAAVRKDLVAAKGGLFRYTLGTCGALRFVRTQTMGLGTDYYDASGTLVATDATGELPVCGDKPLQIGAVPACKEQVVEQKSTLDEPSADR